jgi:hypothetical protein
MEGKSGGKYRGILQENDVWATESDLDSHVGRRQSPGGGSGDNLLPESVLQPSGALHRPLLNAKNLAQRDLPGP